MVTKLNDRLNEFPSKNHVHSSEKSCLKHDLKQFILLIHMLNILKNNCFLKNSKFVCIKWYISKKIQAGIDFP